MIKKSKQQKTIEIEVIDDVICNKCGVSLKENSSHPSGLVEVKSTHAYGSKNHTDEYSFSLCETCMFKMFEEFVITPDYKSDYIDG